MPDSCKACGASVCGCSDVLWNGTVIIDDPDHGGSEPGSYARHIRDTACMVTPARWPNTPATETLLPSRGNLGGGHRAAPALLGEG